MVKQLKYEKKRVRFSIYHILLIMPNTKLINILKNSIYPFQFNKDCGTELLKSYNLIYKCYKDIKNNKIIFQNTLNWDDDQYNKGLLNTLLICDLIYMLTHTYLKYTKETMLFHNILTELESLYFTLFNEEDLIIKNDQLLQYYNQIKQIVRIYNKLKHVYNVEMDKLLVWDDKFTKKYDKDRSEFLSLYLEKKKL